MRRTHPRNCNDPLLILNQVEDLDAVEFIRTINSISFFILQARCISLMIFQVVADLVSEISALELNAQLDEAVDGGELKEATGNYMKAPSAGLLQLLAVL